MKAVILAAGKGERLRPFTETRPKPLIPVLDKPMIEYSLGLLKSLGVRDVLLVVHHHAERLVEFLGDGTRYGVRVRYVNQREPLGTGHALMCVEGLTGDKFLLIYGDVFLFSERPLKALLSSGYNNAVLAVKSETPWYYGVLDVSNGKLVRVVEKPPRGQEPSDLINAGIYLFTERIFDYLKGVKPSERGEIELTDALQDMALKEDVGVVEAKPDEWGELGKPWDVLDLNRRLLELKVREQVVLGEVESGARLKGPVFVGEGAVVRSGAYIEGPVYIGRYATVGPNCYIRPYTVIGEKCRVGNACEVKASVLIKGAHVSHLSYVGDSVLGEHVNLGAGTITANLRFDDAPVKVTLKGVRVSSGRRKLGAFIGDCVKTGTNVSIMPGVKIGSYSWIAPGAVVYRDVPPRSFLKVVNGKTVIVPLNL